MPGAISWPSGTGGSWMRPPALGRTEPNAASSLPLPLAETPRVLGLTVGRERWKCSLCFCPACASHRGLSAPGRGLWGRGGGILPRCAPCPVLSPQRACPLTRSAPIPRRRARAGIAKNRKCCQIFQLRRSPWLFVLCSRSDAACFEFHSFAGLRSPPVRK